MNRRRRTRTLAELFERAKRARARKLAAMRPLERHVFVALEGAVQARFEREVLFGTEVVTETHVWSDDQARAVFARLRSRAEADRG